VSGEEAHVVEPTRVAKLGERTPNTAALVELLSGTREGELVDYMTLSMAIRTDVRSTARHTLTSARAIVLRDNGIVFECISGVGLRQLSGPETVHASLGGVEKIHRACRRERRKIETVDPEKLSAGSRARAYTAASLLGAIEQVTRPKLLRRVEKRVIEVNQTLTLAETLRAFED